MPDDMKRENMKIYRTPVYTQADNVTPLGCHQH